MKIDRLIGIIMILLQQDKTTAPALAERFEVSRRTINRDIEDICKAGIPLATTQGHGGGITIADGYKINKTFFTEEEIQAIFSGLRGLDSVSQTAHLARLVEKLSDKEKRIPTEDIILIDLASHYQAPLTQKIEEIKKGILTKHFLSFRYYYKKGESLRCIEPYRLIFKWSGWYVFGYCLERQAYRLFQLNRLWDLHTATDTFFPREIPPEELLFEDYFASPSIHLHAIFSEQEKHRLIEEYGVDCFSVCQDGRLQLERDFVDYENMRQWIFSFGDAVEILEPKELRQDRITQAKNILLQENS